jgi:epoxyqueuosine reductase
VGRVARYARGRDYHDVIPPRLRALAAAIVELCGPETKCRTFVDTGPLVDRAAAERAGLGFVGKNTCLLTGRYGSYVFLSAILTTAALPSDPFVTRDCGSCRACLNACPTGAFIAPRQLDATRCISYLTIEHRGAIPHALRPRIGDWVFGCDVCQEVCPWNRARSPTAHEEFAPQAGAGNTLDLAELLTLDEAAFRARFRGTPLMRTKRRGLLRNAAIALGNSGDRAVIPALLGALSDAEPLVRGHAAWALGELAPLPAEAIATLRTALAAETDPEARAEMRAALGDP